MIDISWLNSQKFILAQKMRGENIQGKLKQMLKSQWLEGSQVAAMNAEKLREILDYASASCRFYQEKWDAIGGYQDFADIPLLSRREVRDETDGIISKEYSKRRLHEYHSSGSTGEPLALFFTAHAIGYFHAAQYRGFSWYGIKPTDKSVKLWGLPFRRVARFKEVVKDYVMNRKRLSAFNMSADNLMAFYQYCKKLRPAFMYGYSSALYRFAKFLDENEIDGGSLRLKVIICTSEVLYEHQKSLLEKVFGCRAVNEYGAAEVGVIAFECPQGGMHITSENVFVEILAEGKPVQNGEIGEVVVTGLRNYAMPLIRYKLGDLASLSNKTCRCGRGLPLLESINGRNNDLLVGPQGKLIHSEIFAYINRDLIRSGVVIKEFKIIQNVTGSLIIQVERETDPKAIELLRKAVKKRVGREIDISFEFVNRIPTEKSGKVKYFVSEMRG